MVSILLFVAASQAAPAPEPTDSFEARAVSVIDGDSLIVQRTDAAPGARIRLRLYGVDAPELDQPFGHHARRFVERRVRGKVLRVRVKERLDARRLRAIVHLPDDTVLNYALLEAGYAWWQRHRVPESRRMQLLQQQARDTDRGLWRRAQPVPPWIWRRDGGADR
jgi:endonuclease YncB( thermonuclease family)